MGQLLINSLKITVETAKMAELIEFSLQMRIATTRKSLQSNALRIPSWILRAFGAPFAF